MKLIRPRLTCSTRSRILLRCLELCLAALALSITAAGKVVSAQQIEQPSRLPGLAVEQQTLIKNPVTLAVELFRKVYTDAIPQPGSAGGFVLSPGGTQLAFAFTYYGFGPESSMIRIQDIPTGTQREFSVVAWGSSEVVFYAPIWSADGSRLLFTSRGPDPKEDTPYAIWSCRLNGTGLERVTPPNLSAVGLSVSPDGRYLAIRRLGKRGSSADYGDLYILEMASRRGKCLVSGGVGSAHWSADGKWIAFMWHGQREGQQLEVVSADGKKRRTLLNVRRLRQKHPCVDHFGEIVWLPDNRTLLVTMLERPPGSFGFAIWQVGLESGPRSVAPGLALGASLHGRMLLLKLGENYWLARLASGIDKAVGA